MRPTKGPSLTSKSLESLIKSVGKDYVFQPKLNGDRSVLGVTGGVVYIANRHGGWYQHTVDNREVYASLPDGTVLDGEVKDKKFFPFEMINGDGVTPKSKVEERIEAAKKVCADLGVDWIFETPTMEFLNGLEKNAPKWEGVVAKKKGSAYVALGSDLQCSVSWYKLRWI